MAICLPGMPSRVKRAATSATRPAPLVMTTNWMTMRMKNTTRPTRTEPPIDEVAEALDHHAGVGVQEHEAGGADVQGEAEHGGDQEQGREDRELERPLDLHRREQHEDRRT